MYINTKIVKVILCDFITLTSTDKQKNIVNIKYCFILFKKGFKQVLKIIIFYVFY